MKYRLFTLSALMFITFLQLSVRAGDLPQELKGKWEGRIMITRDNGEEHAGNMVIGMGGLLAKSASEIDFTISKFSVHNYFHTKFIENAGRYSTDEAGRAVVSFSYIMPIGIDYKTAIEGKYTLTRFESPDGYAYLYGTFTPDERDYKRIKTDIVLFPKEINKKMNQNKTLENTIAAIVKERSRTTGGSDRVNENATQISDKVLVKINKATGWLKATDGQWLEGRNKIQNLDITSKDIKEAETGVYKIGADNFEWIEVREVTVQGRQLLMIIKKMQSHKDREIFNLNENSAPAIVYAVFDKNKAIFNKAKNEYETSMFYWGAIEASENYLAGITSDINTIALKYPHVSQSKGTEQNLYLCFTTSEKDPDVGRFLLYCSKDVWTGHVFLPIPLLSGSQVEQREPVKDFYFELPAKEIMPVVNLIK